jgi:multimeric flavodoxin WrbA
VPGTPLQPRKEMPPVKLDEATFRRRYLDQFADPAFDPLRAEIDRVASAAWEAYAASRKAPHTRKAGPGYADPEYRLALDWLDGKAAIDAAQSEYEDSARPPRIFLINGSSRSEHTCPGESSKSWRMVRIAEEIAAEAGALTEILDLSRLASEYGRAIHPCKACFSTAAPLCHWPCSCYPNHALGQTQDWMNDIYPMWVRADGIFIVSPVNWYQVSSPLKLMMDRMVCADGGNPDPTLTHGKHADEAKAIELDHWHYPRHLAGRIFAVVSHGDVEGAEGVRRSISDWLKFMKLDPAGPKAELDRYVGYWKPYATSHDELDRDLGLQGEVRNAARALVEAVVLKRQGRWTVPGSSLHEPRQK